MQITGLFGKARGDEFKETRKSFFELLYILNQIIGEIAVVFLAAGYEMYKCKGNKQSKYLLAPHS